MRAQTVESLGIQLLALAAIWDGGRIMIVNQGRLGATEAGGYMVLLGLILLTLALVHLFSGASKGAAPPTNWGEARGLRRVAIALAIAVGYGVLIHPLGYLLATVLFFITYLRIFSSYSLLPIVACSLLGGIASAYLWAYLGLTLPSGILPWP